MGREENKAESKGSRRSGLLTAGGVLSIVGGAFEVFGGAAIVGSTIGAGIRGELLPGLVPGGKTVIGPLWSTIVGVALLALGVVAVLGGVSALRRKSFGLSLAGAICILPVIIIGMLGILAIVSVSISKKEFEVQDSGGIEGR